MTTETSTSDLYFEEIKATAPCYSCWDGMPVSIGDVFVLPEATNPRVPAIIKIILGVDQPGRPNGQVRYFIQRWRKAQVTLPSKLSLLWTYDLNLTGYWIKL